MNDTRIAVAQIAANPGRTKDNAEKLLFHIEAACKKEANLILFPECSLSGYSTQRADEAGLNPEDQQIQKIRQYCKEAGIAACFGYIEKAANGLYITQELTAEGRSVYYRKTHLGSKEKEVFLEGNEFPVLNVPICAGIQLCWESHIPEIAAMERKQGAELLLVPYASPMSKERCSGNWSVHLPARASDNGVFLAACNLLFPPKDGSKDVRGGGMAVFDPKGKRILEFFGTEEKMICCDLKGPLPREASGEDMHSISYFDRKRTELFR